MTERIANEDVPAPEPGVLPATAVRSSIDDMSEWLFPASDPPATWIRDVDR
jgi:hypothetical protein